jgi:CspA family cold shock protein
MMDCETGIVRWFDDEEGQGLIQRDRGGEVYVHYSAIRCDESECSVEKGNKVQFTIIKGPKGLQAQNVTVLESGE